MTKLIEDFHVGGQIENKARRKLTTKNLHKIYSPGVGKIAKIIDEKPKLGEKLTNVANRVAVITNCSAVLGLGRVHPLAAKAVMEAKCLIYKEFAGIDGIDLELKSDDANEIFNFIKIVSNSFSAIHLEDITSPLCFELFEKLAELHIPIFHDDRHATAIAVLVELIKTKNLSWIENAKIVIWGAGAAGIGIAELLHHIGNRPMMFDSKGPVHQTNDLWKNKFAAKTKYTEEDISDADILIAVAKPGSIKEEVIKNCKPNLLAFLLSNPKPDINPFVVKGFLPKAKIYLGHPQDDFPFVNNFSIFPKLMRTMMLERSTMSPRFAVEYAKNMA